MFVNPTTWRNRYIGRHLHEREIGPKKDGTECAVQRKILRRCGERGESVVGSRYEIHDAVKGGGLSESYWEAYTFIYVRTPP